jgi:hypothetical protein
LNPARGGRQQAASRKRGLACDGIQVTVGAFVVRRPRV